MDNDGNKMKNKVLHIIPSMSDGGAQRVIFDYISNKDMMDSYQLEFLSLVKDSNSMYNNKLNIGEYKISYLQPKVINCRIYIIRKLINMISRVLSVCIYIKRCQPVAIHTHMSSILRDMLIPFLLFRGGKFHTMHSDPYSCNKMQVFYTKLAFIYLNVHPVAVSEVQRKKAMIRYGLPKCDLLRNSIDIDAIQQSVERMDKSALRRKYNIPKHGVVIGSVGRLHPVKNYDGLIKIFAEYKKSANNPVYLAIAGDGEERGNLISLAQKLGVADSVFLVGNIEIDHVYEFYKMLDIFVMTSHTEAAPMSFLEAQAVGVRCVVASSVDPSMVYRKNVRCMEHGASISDWCFAFSDANYVNKNVFPSEEFDLSTVMERLEKIYDKYL